LIACELLVGQSHGKTAEARAAFRLNISSQIVADKTLAHVLTHDNKYLARLSAAVLRIYY